MDKAVFPVRSSPDLPLAREKHAVRTAVGIASDIQTNRRIFFAAGSVAVAGAAVKIVSLGKEFVVAGTYGRSDSMDAFLAAFLLPNLLINLIAESTNQALIPTLVRVRINEGRERARQLLSGAMLSMAGQLTLASCAMAGLARFIFPLICSGFAPGKLDLSIRLFYGLLPVVLFTGIATNCTAVLTTENHFAIPGLCQIAVPIAMIAGALLLNGQCGIWALVYAAWIGALVHMALVGAMLVRCGYCPGPERLQNSEALRQVSRQYLPVFMSSIVASGGLVVDQAMAAMLPSGSVSSLVFANRFVSVAVTLMGGAIASAITPHLSEAIACGAWRECRETLRVWTRRMAAISVPVALILIAGAQPLVRLTLQHGAFGPTDTAVVKSVLTMYVIQIPFFVVSRVYYRFVIAMRRTDLVFYSGVVNLALDVLLNLAFMPRLGVAGIALATSCWSAGTLLFLWCSANRLLSAAEDPHFQVSA